MRIWKRQDSLGFTRAEFKVFKLLASLLLPLDISAQVDWRAGGWPQQLVSIAVTSCSSADLHFILFISP